MNNYVVSKLELNEFEAIVTLLDFEVKISDYFKDIKISSFNKNRLVIDTALCSGMNEYRFIETKLNEDGTIDLGKYKYIDVNSQILEVANNIIKDNRLSLENSILTKSQKNLLQ